MPGPGGVCSQGVPERGAWSQGVPGGPPGEDHLLECILVFKIFEKPFEIKRLLRSATEMI